MFKFNVMKNIFLVSGHGFYEGDSSAGFSVLHSNCYYFTGLMVLKDPEGNHSF